MLDVAVMLVVVVLMAFGVGDLDKLFESSMVLRRSIFCLVSLASLILVAGSIDESGWILSNKSFDSEDSQDGFTVADWLLLKSS